MEKIKVNGVWKTVGGSTTPDTSMSGSSTNTVQNKVIKSYVDDETTARTNADTTLQTNITNEATARGNADTTLQTNIDNEATARGTADSTLQDNIDAEATLREDADDERYTKTESDNRYAQKATTLAGYGITDAYTKTQSDNSYNKKIVAATLGLTYATGWSADTSSRYVNRCYKITDNLYYICIFIKNSAAMTAGTSYTAFNASGLTIGGKVPYVCTLTAVDRTTQAVVGCWVNYEGKVYLVPSKAVGAGDGICIAGILHTV